MNQTLQRKKTGILGGTFDPVHNGHLQLAKSALDELQLDMVVLMVAPDPPHKKDREITGMYHRLEMTRGAVEGLEGIECSMYEATLPVPSYTAQTLEHLRGDFQDTDFYFIVGEDSLDAIETWYHPEKVMKLATLVVARRKEEDDDKTVEEQADHLREKFGAKIIELRMDMIDISSTQIRKMVADGEDISALVPASVDEYIKQNGLYKKA